MPQIKLILYRSGFKRGFREFSERYDYRHSYVCKVANTYIVGGRKPSAATALAIYTDLWSIIDAYRDAPPSNGAVLPPPTDEGASHGRRPDQS